ncbi:zinc finger protein with KRAB and SCAN domains 7-like [Anopheles funestus]|uniref:Protein krueppel n=1 Tax=Anopheles funestus TaxID=62324 RepID=A0A4Y0BTK5_ANOFN|nr:zinc finger protein with KRAB and SCAN domains 7-like [Anopheles funestus]
MDCVLATETGGKLESDVCRGCGGKNATKPLSVYGNIFKWCTSIDISCSDGLPSHICHRCLQMLSISYEFKVACNRTDRHLRAKANNATHMETGTSSENVLSDEYEQSELVFEVQAEEVVEEMVLTDKQSLDYGCKSIPVIEQSIAKETGDGEQDKIFGFELFSDEGYLLPVAEKRDEISSMSDEDEAQDIRDAEEQDKNEELVLNDTVDYLEDTCKESPVYEKSGTCGKSVSVVACLRHEPPSAKTQSVRHRCPDCGKEFASKTNMYRHQHAHRGSKPYKCDICKKGFTQSGTLKTHRNTHFNIKPFVCNVCGQRFTQSKSVKLHLRRHTGEKPFVCDICNAAFRQKNGLQRHMKVHSEKA